MSGLIQKDLCILKQRQQFFIMLLGISILLAFTNDQSFVVGYLSLLCAIFSISTLNYDEFDHSYAFLMTLPITEKIYVMEKFVFASLLGVAGWIVSILIVILVSLLQATPLYLVDFIDYLIFIPIGVIFVALNLPIQLKFGQEKSRMVMIGMMGIFILIGFGLSKAANVLHIPTEQLVNMMDQISSVYYVVAGVIICVILCAISAKISIAIMQKKEY